VLNYFTTLEAHLRRTQVCQRDYALKNAVERVALCSVATLAAPNHGIQMLMIDYTCLLLPVASLTCAEALDDCDRTVPSRTVHVMRLTDKGTTHYN
jgi:hypothetical protein